MQAAYRLMFLLGVSGKLSAKLKGKSSDASSARPWASMTA